MVILRSVGDNGIHVAMDYGPHGGSHGHPDPLNLVIHANGRLQAPDFGNGGTYALKEWREWYKQTVSRGKFSIRTDRMATLYLERKAEDAYLLVQRGGDAAHLEIGCADWEHVSLFGPNEPGAPAGEIDSSVENNVLSFMVNPDSKYQIRFR